VACGCLRRGFTCALKQNHPVFAPLGDMGHVQSESKSPMGCGRHLPRVYQLEQRAVWFGPAMLMSGNRSGKCPSAAEQLCSVSNGSLNVRCRAEWCASCGMNHACTPCVLLCMLCVSCYACCVCLAMHAVCVLSECSIG